MVSGLLYGLTSKESSSPLRRDGAQNGADVRVTQAFKKKLAKIFNDFLRAKCGLELDSVTLESWGEGPMCIHVRGKTQTASSWCGMT
jgi:hypothetical protein